MLEKSGNWVCEEVPKTGAKREERSDQKKKPGGQYVQTGKNTYPGPA